MSASSLELEITESAMMLDPARALRVIQEIDKLGVLISIDDFGTGYSSLGYLRDLPVHSLKLDKSFVMGMRNNTDDRIIVESTAQMAHALKLELVAEGVETEWDAQFLAAAGYDYAQGFRYSRALPPDKCLAWIVEFNATAMLTAGDTTVTTALRARAEREDDDFASRTGRGSGVTCARRRAALTPRTPPGTFLTALEPRHPGKSDLEPDIRGVVEILQVLGDGERHQAAIEAMPHADTHLVLLAQQLIQVGLLALVHARARVQPADSGWCERSSAVPSRCTIVGTTCASCGDGRSSPA